MDFSRFEELLKLWQDGDASPAELQEFEALLRSDPAFRKELVGSVLLESALYRRYAAAAAAPAVRKSRRWEAAAAIVVAAVSLFAVGRLLFRSDTPVVDLSVDGALTEIHQGRFEVGGLKPLACRLPDGSRAVFDAGSAGKIPAPGQPFELSRGSASFFVSHPAGAFRVQTPAGSLSIADGQVWVLLRPPTRKLPKELARKPELVVETARGSVDVDAWDARASVPAGQRRVFGPPLPAGGTDYAGLLSRTGITLSAAIAKATAASPGIPVHAELEEEDGRVAFSIGLVRDGKAREVAVDAQTGKVLEDEDDDDDRSRVAAAVT
ncbi:MAG TPA: PepSY domain-containing protein, partial [Planctomycetota bacterium]|nr:PepSY domain-containing protein [Planctomycetota bacterium]